MANCSICKKPVGCGCNLKNGACATCSNAKPAAPAAPLEQTQKIPTIKNLLDVIKNGNKEQL